MDKRVVSGIEAGIIFGVALIIVGMAYSTVYERFIMPMPDGQRVGLMNIIGMINLLLIVVMYLLAGVVSAMWSKRSIKSAMGSLMPGAIAGAVASFTTIALSVATLAYQAFASGHHLSNLEMTIITMTWPAIIVLGAIVSAVGACIYAQMVLKL
jgi:hypothetical protein